MENIASKILDSYGLPGLMILAILFVIWWFTHNIDKKDAQIVDICTRFANSLDANTLAVQELCARERDIKSSHESTRAEIHEFRKDNQREHNLLLDVVLNKKVGAQ